MGNPTPDVVNSVPAAAAAAAAAATGPVDLKAAESNAQTELNVQESEPTTNVQVTQIFYM